MFCAEFNYVLYILVHYDDLHHYRETDYRSIQIEHVNLGIRWLILR